MKNDFQDGLLEGRRREGSAEARLGRAVRALREARGWSQGQLATQLSRARQQARPTEQPPKSYTQSMIAKIETAGRPTVLDEAVWLATIFGNSLEVMLTLDEVPDLAAEITRLEAALVALDEQIETLRRERTATIDELVHLRWVAQSAAVNTRTIEDLAEHSRIRAEWEEAKAPGMVLDPDENAEVE